MSREQREEMSLLIELNAGFVSVRLYYAIKNHSPGRLRLIPAFFCRRYANRANLIFIQAELLNEWRLMN